MKYEYFKHNIAIEDEIVDSYGIILFSNDSEVIKIHDISTNIDTITTLVNVLNEKRLDPLKLGSFLEEYMSQADFI